MEWWVVVIDVVEVIDGVEAALAVLILKMTEAMRIVGDEWSLWCLHVSVVKTSWEAKGFRA